MYINGVLLGVLATLFAEMLVLIIAAVCTRNRKKKPQKAEDKSMRRM